MYTDLMAQLTKLTTYHNNGNVLPARARRFLLDCSDGFYVVADTDRTHRPVGRTRNGSRPIPMAGTCSEPSKSDSNNK